MSFLAWRAKSNKVGSAAKLTTLVFQKGSVRWREIIAAAYLGSIGKQYSCGLGFSDPQKVDALAIDSRFYRK